MLQGSETQPPDPLQARNDDGLALCLSGGGFRATLFHLGALRRLNELGLLSQIHVITSVSGGSILNGILAKNWHRLTHPTDGRLDGFEEAVANPTRAFCKEDIRTHLIFGSRLDPANWPMLVADFLSLRANLLAAAYEKQYEEHWLSQVPAPQPGKVPRFVFCATSVQTGACWHFHAGPDGRMGDFYTGYLKTGRTTIAQAVAASSAFPPGFGALRLHIPFPDAFDRIDPWGDLRQISDKREDLPLKHKRSILLTDGGVYDNLGVEPVWRRFTTLIVSDAGRPFCSKGGCSQAVLPRLKRAADISMEQVGAVRQRWLIERFQTGTARGVLWAIDTPFDKYPFPAPHGYNRESRNLLASIRTDLNPFSDGEMNCLENHGYSLAEAAMRTFTHDRWPRPRPPFRLPHSHFSSDEACQHHLTNSSRRTLLRDICRYVVKTTYEESIKPARKLYARLTRLNGQQ